MLLLLLLTSVLGTLNILLFIAIALDQQGGFEFFLENRSYSSH